MTSASSHEATNAKMVKFLPELASTYAKYPMKHHRWFDEKEKDSQGRPCYVKSPTNAGPRPDYVWGQGKFGHGYYHMMTQAAYKNLSARLKSEAPAGGCYCFSASARKEMDEWDDVKRIMHNRAVASRPDDGIGASDALNTARFDAKQYYNGTQNEQLAINTVQILNA